MYLFGSIRFVCYLRIPRLVLGSTGVGNIKNDDPSLIEPIAAHNEPAYMARRFVGYIDARCMCSGGGRPGTSAARALPAGQ